VLRVTACSAGGWRRDDDDDAPPRRVERRARIEEVDDRIEYGRDAVTKFAVIRSIDAVSGVTSVGVPVLTGA
jgi:hypothetical protein